MDCWIWLLLWTSWSEWTLRLWRAVLELCRHQGSSCGRAGSNAHANAHAHAFSSTHAYVYQGTRHSFEHFHTSASTNASTNASTDASSHADNAVMRELCRAVLKSMYLDRLYLLPHITRDVHDN